MNAHSSGQAVSRLTVTVQEAAGLLGIGRATAYEAVRTGVIPSIRVGKRFLVPKLALERLLEGQTQPRQEP